MRSIVAVTNEIDDAEKAVSELLKQIEDKGPLDKNSLGIVYCDAEVNHDGFAAALQEKLPFDVAGCVSIATFDAKNGTQSMSVVLLILTADDVCFSSAVTGALTEENLRHELEAAYKKASADLGTQSELIILIPPFFDAVPLDDYIKILDGLSGDVPVFGGMPSSNIPDIDIPIYAGGRPYNDRAVIVLIGGNVRPVFSVQNLMRAHSEQKFIVTKAHKNVIYTVDDMPFTDYLKSVGIDADELMAQGDLAVYVSTPIRIYMEKDGLNGGIPVIRTIKSLSPSDGSGVLFGAIAEKSAISMATMKRRDIQDSCKMAINEIQEKITAEDAGYAYTTLLCISCGGRYIVMADDKDMEGDIIVENLSKNLTLSGFYAFGEICPTGFHDGRAVNRIHNESIVMCAL